MGLTPLESPRSTGGPPTDGLFDALDPRIQLPAKQRCVACQTWRYILIFIVCRLEWLLLTNYWLLMAVLLVCYVDLLPTITDSELLTIPIYSYSMYVKWSFDSVFTYALICISQFTIYRWDDEWWGWSGAYVFLVTGDVHPFTGVQAALARNTISALCHANWEVGILSAIDIKTCLFEPFENLSRVLWEIAATASWMATMPCSNQKLYVQMYINRVREVDR